MLDCVYKAVGSFENGQFDLSGLSHVNIRMMGAKEMRQLVTVGLGVLKDMTFYDQAFYQSALKAHIPTPGIKRALKRAKELLNNSLWPGA